MRVKSGARTSRFDWLMMAVLSLLIALVAVEASASSKVLTPEERLSLNGHRQRRWEANSADILKRISNLRGEAGIVVEDLETGWTFIHNEDQPFPAASLVKIPIMVACFKAAQEGRLDLSEKHVLRREDRVGGSGILRRMRNGRSFTYSQLIDYMVTESDNIACNIMIDRLGFDYINQVFEELGLEKTRLNRKMIDFAARDQGIENYTTAAEMTGLLDRIYHHRCFNAEISERCLAVLKRQKINDRLPRYLPKEVTVAHKTGLEKEVCHDAGIVFTPSGDYIITVLVHTWGGPGSAKIFIGRLSSYFYEIFKT
ncbi:MAG TPA: class A beta-lactamase-related serine hydrolase [Candidatus Saccharicenans sp.]|jgi:beta-lactamase class A|nr:class A beta-lactamase-related serine hydrolase [Candidatus Saccharicenans sp.]HOP60106.1 class A beta-lactamase-related serine hydrolase [Candidatus Saccharicenans sp.]HOT69247.1 class A beta-lactamase-related serine hydrolase [Candidatus Saccharicenans sp.]HPP24319.1 class A beta-lactamase-related serine hydrolase [Candidatus Saccharicenans sp.]HPU92621.1 class A beta-lactamase-related serine hydrolase [Candidatus Saccharicenans sp.]